MFRALAQILLVHKATLPIYTSHSDTQPEIHNASKYTRVSRAYTLQPITSSHQIALHPLQPRYYGAREDPEAARASIEGHRAQVQGGLGKATTAYVCACAEAENVTDSNWLRTWLP